MTTRVYDKLVRDRIPEIITNTGKTAVTRALSDKEYSEALVTKLAEEVAEFAESRDIEELADVLEVVRALCTTSGLSQEELEAVRVRKFEERGGFDRRVHLLRVDGDGATP